MVHTFTFYHIQAMCRITEQWLLCIDECIAVCARLHTSGHHVLLICVREAIFVGCVWLHSNSNSEKHKVITVTYYAKRNVKI